MESYIKLVEDSARTGYWVSPAFFWVGLLLLATLLITFMYFVRYYRNKLKSQSMQLENLREDSDSFRYLVETAHEGIAVVQDKKLVYLNPRICEMSGYQEAELKALPSFIPLIHPSAQDEMVANYQRRLKGEKAPQRYESLFLRKNGSSYPIEISGVAITWQGKPATLNMLTDISYRKSIETKLQYLAHHDSLTGLPNRLVLSERLDAAIIQAQHNHESLAVVFLDLNGFKQVNDTYGHELGDALLQQVTQRLKPLFRDSDTFARMGGDEFVVLLTQIKDRQSVVQSMARINAAMAEPFQIQGYELPSYASQGSAIYPEDGTTAKALLSFADKNMYTNKQQYYQHH